MKNIFSIIVPIYNCEKYISKTIDSVLGLNFDNFELILVDDGSVDNTSNICLGYSDSRIKYYKKENGGVSSARNFGLSKASGDYIVFLDSDDSLEHNCLDTYLEIMEYSDFVISGYNCVDMNGNKMEHIINFDDINVDINDFSKYFEYLYNNAFFNSPWCKCYKRELIDFEFDDKTSLGEDFLFNLLYLKNCKSIYITNKITYNYLLNQNGLSQRLLVNCFENINYVFINSVNFLKDIFKDNYFKYNIECVLVKKYIFDFITLLDRNILCNGFKIEDVDIVLKKFDLFNLLIVFDLNSVDFKVKFKLNLLKNKKIKLYIFFIKFKNILKKVVKK